MFVKVTGGNTGAGTYRRTKLVFVKVTGGNTGAGTQRR